MFNPAYGFINDAFMYNLNNYMFILLVGIVLSTPVYQLFRNKVKSFRIIKGLAFAGLFIITISFMVRNTYNPFLYFRF
jgi:alginate O-acetyltransferase complex protein AlgI